ncbi:hypothetical protein DRP44_07615 [candidate division TA06 bacterium]|uniref:Uncharacterized protein n=1 Tax=candidate division TA06 bacterium TaxID=2250710 RepID=A0A660S589_UNCT6|nr:MAG: hypothetical protein DRP44_07615 [candidate division TA06 bacterium]
MRKEIRVGVICDPRKGVIPVWFVFMGEKYKIKDITYRWVVRKGVNYTDHYSVSDGENQFEIVYDRLNAKWMIENIYNGYDSIIP